jgi:hypothetical protein
MIEPKGQGKLGAIATSETEFFVKQVDATLTFTLGPDNKATELRVVQGGSPMVAKRVQ